MVNMIYRENQALIWDKGRTITQGEFLQKAACLAGLLATEKADIINLCRNRYHFMLIFCAALMLKRLTILPPNPLAQVVDALLQQPAQTPKIQLDDAHVLQMLETVDTQTSVFAPRLPEDDFPAVTLFTSGTTGSHVAHTHHWHLLRNKGYMLHQALCLESACHSVVTVPPQHMYGLEMSVLLPLLGGHAVESGQPMFPEDIRTLLQHLPAPRMLVTTPLHLKACLLHEGIWPKTAHVISATAPLSLELAHTAKRWAERVSEIYGCTETGSLACRQLPQEMLWTPLAGVSLSHHNACWYAHEAHRVSHPLSDALHQLEDGRFQLLGRHRDMVKIAGKRHSLSALSSLLQAAPGVVDAVVLPPGEGFSDQRLSALIVMDKHHDVAHIKAWLRERIDAVFIPRPFVVVNEIPRNAMGKLPRQNLEHLLVDLKKSRIEGEYLV